MLTDEEAGMLLKALFSYVYDDQEPSTDNRVVTIAFSYLKASIDAKMAKADNLSRKRAEAVKVRWDRRRQAQDEKPEECDTNVYKCIQTNTNVYNCIDNEGEISTDGQNEPRVENTNEYNCIICNLQEENKAEKENSPTPPIKNKEENKEEELLQKRARNFYTCLVPFVDQYGKEMMREFYDYWTEPNKSRTKMRYELEKTWDITRRLRTWASRQTYRYGRDTKFNQQQQRQQDAADIIARLAAEEN